MNYTASISDFFKSPKWGMNLLFGAIALIIPLIGPLVLGGWHITGFWARGDDRDPARFPAFDFDDFMKYLERGLWPFLVNLVASLAMVPVIMIGIVPALFFSGAIAPHGDHAGEAAIPALALGIFCLQLVLMLIYQFIAIPLTLRATITQGFSAAFDFRFVMSFLSRVWKEMLLAMLFMFCVGIVLMILGIITCYIGFIAGGPVALFGWHHLQKQLYQLHLARGGETVPPSPKLNDTPPALPTIG